VHEGSRVSEATLAFRKGLSGRGRHREIPIFFSRRGDCSEGAKGESTRANAWQSPCHAVPFHDSCLYCCTAFCRCFDWDSHFIPSGSRSWREASASHAQEGMARGARKRSTTASLTVAHNAPDATDSREGFGSGVRSLSKRRKDVSEVSTVAAAESVDAGSGLSQNRSCPARPLPCAIQHRIGKCTIMGSAAHHHAVPSPRSGRGQG
jgi:hypothetical protein